MIEMIKLNTTLWEYRKCVLLKKGTEIYYSKESCFISRSIKQCRILHMQKLFFNGIVLKKYSKFYV